jgi:hypothetical protein
LNNPVLKLLKQGCITSFTFFSKLETIKETDLNPEDAEEKRRRRKKKEIGAGEQNHVRQGRVRRIETSFLGLLHN